MIYYACIAFFMLTISNEVTVTATIYHAVEGQTDSTPNLTATMFEIDLSNPRKHNIIAVSRDLESMGFKMNQKVLIQGAGDLSGEWIIRDRMNKRFTKRIDFLVNTTRKGGKWENVKISLIK